MNIFEALFRVILTALATMAFLLIAAAFCLVSMGLLLVALLVGMFL
jgi:hypothetical protein